MANLYIGEYRELPVNNAPIAPARAIVEQKITSSGVSAQSAAFNSQTRYIRLVADGNMHYLVGSNPTATTSNLPLVLENPEYFAVNPGDKIAVIDRA